MCLFLLLCFVFDIFYLFVISVTTVICMFVILTNSIFLGLICDLVCINGM